jgi:hypothetical protein
MENKVNIKEKLLNIQNELKAPKNQRNSFGGYKYRSAEDILEAVKPIAHKYKTIVNLSDEIIVIGQHNPIVYEQEVYDTKLKKMIVVKNITGDQRFYIKATATLIDTESSETIVTTANAREEENKRGMDQSQITGTASSYARKYAMNGLFAIDDTKDADTDEHANQTKEVKEPKATKQQIDQIKELFKDTQIPSLLKRANVKKIEDIPMTIASDFIKKMQEAQAQA